MCKFSLVISHKQLIFKIKEGTFHVDHSRYPPSQDFFRITPFISATLLISATLRDCSQSRHKAAAKVRPFPLPWPHSLPVFLSYHFWAG